MDELQAEILVDELTEKDGWDTWKPMNQQRRDWVSLFVPYTVEIGRKAIRAAWQNSKGRKPTAGAVKGELLTLHSRSLSDEPAREGPWMSGWWIQCVEAPEGHPGRLGWYFPLIYPHKGAEEYQIQTTAEKMRATHEDMYGGRWDTFRDTNHQQMEGRRQTLRAEKNDA